MLWKQQLWGLSDPASDPAPPSCVALGPSESPEVSFSTYPMGIGIPSNLHHSWADVVESISFRKRRDQNSKHSACQHFSIALCFSLLISRTRITYLLVVFCLFFPGHTRGIWKFPD